MADVEYEIAVSSLNFDLHRAIERFSDFFGISSVVVHFVHQVTDDGEYDCLVESLSRFENVRYSRLSVIGLPISRNYALSSASAKYLIPTDSDVVLFPRFLDVLREAFSNFQDADFITFKSYRDTDFSMPRRKYSDTEFVHNGRSLLSVSSIEIVLNVVAFKEKRACWDEDFGLGAKFPGGLETVMLQDAHRKGCRGYFYPKALSAHIEPSSGADLTGRRVYTRTAVFCRIYGLWLGMVAGVLFHVKNPRYFFKLGPFKVVSNAVKAARDYAKYVKAKGRQ